MQSKLHIAYLIAQHLRSKGEFAKLSDIVKNFKSLAPNVYKEVSARIASPAALINPRAQIALPSADKEWGVSTSTFQDQSIWSPEGLTKYLSSAADLLHQVRPTALRECRSG